MRRNTLRLGTAILTLILTVSMMATPALAAPPANDDRASAEVIAALPFETGLNTAEATAEPDEPEACAPIGATIWYAFTPATATWLEANTFDSGFDTVIGVWTDVGGTLEPVACNDDSATAASRVVWKPQTGIEYLLQVGGFAASVGDLSFRVFETTRPTMVKRLAIRGGVVRDGTLILDGVLRCVGAEDRVFVRTSGRQLWRRVYIRGSGSKWVRCHGRVEFRIKLTNRTGLFAPGHVRVRSFAFNDFSFVRSTDRVLAH